MRRKWCFYLDQKGISLAEILITLVIVGLLTTIGLPYYQKSKRKALQTEAKTLLVKLYASERAFIGEWGYGTPNFHQLGFFPRGNVFYNAGWKDNSIVIDDNVNKVNGTVTISDYEGPYLPSNSSFAGYPYAVLPANLEQLTNVKEACKESVFDKNPTEPETPCIFNPSAGTEFDIPDKFPGHDIQINNKNAPRDDIEFKIGARGYFDGSPHSDEWVIDHNGNLKNVQIGL